MQLGFHQPLSRLYVFIRNEGNHLWYWLQDGEKRYIQYTAITGVLKGLEVKESRGVVKSRWWPMRMRIKLKREG